MLTVAMRAALGGRCRVSAAMLRLRASGDEKPGAAATLQVGEASGLARLLVVLEVGQIGHIPPRARVPASKGQSSEPGSCGQRQAGQKEEESEGRNARARPLSKEIMKAASNSMAVRVAESLTLSAEWAVRALCPSSVAACRSASRIHKPRALMSPDAYAR